MRKECKKPERGNPIHFLPPFEYRYNGVLLERSTIVSQVLDCLHKKGIKNVVIKRKHEKFQKGHDKPIWHVSSEVPFKETKNILKQIFK